MERQWVDEFDFAVQAAAGSVTESRYFAEAGLLTDENASLLQAPHDRSCFAVLVGQAAQMLTDVGGVADHVHDPVKVAGGGQFSRFACVGACRVRSASPTHGLGE